MGLTTISGDGEPTGAENGGAIARTRKRAHVLMLFLEEEGHFVVFLQLLYYFNTLDIAVTVCSSQRRIIDLKVLQRKGDFNGLDLRLVELSEDSSDEGPPAHLAPGPPALIAGIHKTKAQFQAYRKKLTTADADSKPTCLVVDPFLPWTVEVATELGIPRYILFTGGAWLPYLFLKAKTENWKKSGGEIVDIPGQLSAHAKDLPFMLFNLLNLENSSILINSFEELEGEIAVEAIRNSLPKLTTRPGSKGGRFYAVGPMVRLPGYQRTASKIESNEGAIRSRALEWLSEQAESSVLYVAFGSVAQIPPPLVFELARGLELSGVPFLLVLRASPPTKDVTSLLPPRFLERVGKRGFVETGWAAQNQILQHRSTGGFLSHCGWNSVLEGINSGVPFLTWPLHGDQPVNARLIVECLKVGQPIRKLGSPTPVVPGEDVAAAVKSLMDGGHAAAEIRKNSSRLKEIARGSMEDGGSSRKNLQQFANDIDVN